MEDAVIFLEAVGEQITSDQTPYVKRTHERLMAEEEMDEEEAKFLIACCLAEETCRMAEENRSFDETRYRKLLDFLPHLPE